ncbi:YhcH/YjgK/YiaL family protein [Chryseobacterium defluvii]|uniref:YhcH/YjgK/YiaL family protein n=1 Tax=Chryseobacterium defluvii TaxID=160396 RepID=A0A840KDH1_9FLAO|nr:YhcH/YjgK/YiaL family protein [Chryseobacterium defluvii]MBB4806595.1 YhcH/YjgK/YiaL family protein [Chryseobacterium defluvii]
MILDSLNNLKNYIGEDLSPKVNEFLETPVNKLVFGNWAELDENAKLIVLNTSGFKENTFEIHKNYIDFHIPIEGFDTIYFGSNESKKAVNEYDEKLDYQLFSSTALSQITMGTGCFIKIDPLELHTNQLNSENAVKLVLKIKHNG